MSRCGKTEQLEALVMGELDATRARAMQTHTAQCAACHHELNWLKSERLMFEHRLAREQVERLWVGFSNRRAASIGLRNWSRWALAIAASVVVMTGLASKARPGSLESGESIELLMSLEAMSRDVDSAEGRCTRLPPGLGFTCGPYLPASFVAQRE